MARSNHSLAFSLSITAVFNTLIALVLYFMVLDEKDFWPVFTVSQVTGFSICSFVFWGISLSENRFQKWHWQSTAAGLLLGILCSGLINGWVLTHLYGVEPIYFYRHIFLYIAVFGMVFGVPIIYFFKSREKLMESEQKIQAEKIKRLSMEKEAAMTTLKLLQAQIEPHFLFNTLANVIMLFDMDTALAKKMLIHVNEYLRISLERTRQEMITLEQELDLVRHYLDIFKIRMGRRLSFEIKDLTGIPDLPFPPLTIQPLVENAVKHGIEPKVDGGHIEISCQRQEARLRIRVSDTGLGLENAGGNAGVGINNVSRRLEHIYAGQAHLTLAPNRPCGLTAQIEVPI